MYLEIYIGQIGIRNIYRRPLCQQSEYVDTVFKNTKDEIEELRMNLETNSKSKPEMKHETAKRYLQKK